MSIQAVIDSIAQEQYDKILFMRGLPIGTVIFASVTFETHYGEAKYTVPEKYQFIKVGNDNDMERILAQPYSAMVELNCPAANFTCPAYERFRKMTK